MARSRRLTGITAWYAAYTKMDHQPLLDAFGVQLDDALLRLALTHRSFANENDHLPENERLEFLGDAVLGLCVAEQLYREFPDRSESEISKMRAAVVNMYALAEVGRELNIGPHILLGRGEVRNGGEDKNSILADTMEALLGAIYLECGFEKSREVILRIFGKRITEAPTKGVTMDWKTVLLEKLSHTEYGQPDYLTTGSGPDHERVFHSVVIIDEEEHGRGTGSTKKEAEHAAARAAVLGLSHRA